MARAQLGEQAAHLAAAPQPRQIEMHADDAQFLPADADLGHHRAARLQRRQFENAAIEQLGRLADEQGIAVPAEPAGADVERHRLPWAMLDQIVRDRTVLEAEAAIRLLQRDDVGVDLAQYVDDAIGAAAAVRADTLVDIVAGDENHCGGERIRGAPVATLQKRHLDAVRFEQLRACRGASVENRLRAAPSRLRVSTGSTLRSKRTG